MLFYYQKHVFLENQTHPVHSKRGKEHIRHKTDAQNIVIKIFQMEDTKNYENFYLK